MGIPEHMEEMLKKIASKNNEDAIIRSEEYINCTARRRKNVLRLKKKALYGLRQAGKQWNFRLNQKLRSLRLNPTKGELCLYMAHRGQDVLLLLIYVDDILGEVKSSERFPLANKAKKRSELFTLPNINRIARIRVD